MLSLEQIMSTLGVKPDRRKDAAGWLGEKLCRLSETDLHLSYSPLSRLVNSRDDARRTGEQGLWEALAEAPAAAMLSGEVERLAERARNQFSRLEALRRRAAREALS